MQAERVRCHYPHAVRGFALLTAGLAWCCGSDEGTGQRPPTPFEAGAAGDEGAAGDATAAGTAGAPVGGNDQVAGGRNGGGAPGASGSGGSEQQAGAPSGGAGAAGEGPTNGGENLAFCDRLTMRTINSSEVARRYNHAVYDDCRTRWVTDLYLQQGEQDDFLNDLLTWNLQLWGCQPPAVENFALIYGEAPLSAGDAALLIEHYVTVASDQLAMSEPEISAMQAALQRLAQPLIQDPSPAPSQPLCDAGAGGAGGNEPGGQGGSG